MKYTEDSLITLKIINYLVITKMVIRKYFEINTKKVCFGFNFGQN